MNPRKRILFFIESFAGGGAERVLYSLVRNIDRSRFDVSILVMSDTGAQRDNFHALGVNIINAIDTGCGLLDKIKYKLVYNYLPARFACKWMLHGVSADTYVAFVEGYCTKIFSTLPPKKRKLAWVHIDLKTFPWTLKKRIFDNLEAEIKAYQTFNQVVGVSESVAEVMRQHYGIEDTLSIYNIVDENRIQSLGKEAHTVAVQSDTFNIVTTGRLTVQKGYDRLISLFRRIVNRHPKAKLYVIGEGEERPVLEQQIEELGLKDNVILTGFMQNPYALMKQMDLFVCSSLAEGYSLVIAEAITLGLPIISTNCAGPCDLLDNGKYGELCNSYEELEMALLCVIENSHELESLRNKSAERKSFFDSRSIMKQIEAIL